MNMFSFNNLFQNAKKNAGRRGIPFELSLSEFNELVESSKGRCAVSGIIFRTDRLGSESSHRPFIPSLDRIDSELGYTKSNCRLVCVVVNYAMNAYGDKPLVELLETMHANKVRRVTTRVMNDVRRRRAALIEDRYTEERYLTSGRFRDLFGIPSIATTGSLTKICRRLADEDGVDVRLMANPSTNLSLLVTPITFTQAFPLFIWRRAVKEVKLRCKMTRRPFMNT